MQTDIYNFGKFFPILSFTCCHSSFESGLGEKKKRKRFKIVTRNGFWCLSHSFTGRGLFQFRNVFFKRYKRQNILLLHLKDFIFFVICVYIFSHSPEVDFLPVITYFRLLTPKMLGITFKIFITTSRSNPYSPASANRVYRSKSF